MNMGGFTSACRYHGTHPFADPEALHSHVFSFLLFTEYTIYWLHRALHHPRLYKTFHKPHHQVDKYVTVYSPRFCKLTYRPSPDPLRVSCIPPSGWLRAIRALSLICLPFPPPPMGIPLPLCLCKPLDYIRAETPN
jgi:hypothetical protein